jgi:predicted RNase H-like HicB family nuclease
MPAGGGASVRRAVALLGPAIACTKAAPHTARQAHTPSACYHGPGMKFTVILEPEAEGGYSVVCPTLPGCVSQGDSLEEALANIREAILLCLEVRREDQVALPVETPELIAHEIRECLEDRAEEGLPLTIETREVEVEAEVAV